MKADSLEFHPDFYKPGFGIKIDFRDKLFVRKFERARRTLLKLASKGQRFKIRSYRRHRGWGNYEFEITDPLLAYKDDYEKIENSTVNNGITSVPVYLSNDAVKRVFKGKIEIDAEGYRLYSMSVYGSMDLVYSGDRARDAASEDAKRFVYDNLDCFEVIAWQSYCEYVSTYNRLVFDKEIHDWRRRNLISIGKQKNEEGQLKVHNQILKKSLKMIEKGLYYEAKTMLENASKFEFARNVNASGTVQDSLRQLRALGFVA